MFDFDSLGSHPNNIPDQYIHSELAVQWETDWVILHQPGNEEEEEITHPCIVVEWIHIAICNGFIDPRENGLRSDHSPSCTPFRRSLKLAVEPIFLPTAHHRAACIIRDLVDVMCIPVQIGDGSVVVTSIKHDKVKQCPERFRGQRSSFRMEIDS